MKKSMLPKEKLVGRTLIVIRPNGSVYVSGQLSVERTKQLNDEGCSLILTYAVAGDID